MTRETATRHARSNIPDKHGAVTARRRKLGIIVASNIVKLVSQELDS